LLSLLSLLIARQLREKAINKCVNRSAGRKNDLEEANTWTTRRPGTCPSLAQLGCMWIKLCLHAGRTTSQVTRKKEEKKRDGQAEGPEASRNSLSLPTSFSFFREFGSQPATQRLCSHNPCQHVPSLSSSVVSLPLGVTSLPPFTCSCLLLSSFASICLLSQTAQKCLRLQSIYHMFESPRGTSRRRTM